jgi:hypothetical protein
MAVAETFERESLVALVLSEPERNALVRVLYVVKDNFWLDDVEQSLLDRLLEKGGSWCTQRSGPMESPISTRCRSS